MRRIFDGLITLANLSRPVLFSCCLRGRSLFINLDSIIVYQLMLSRAWCPLVHLRLSGRGSFATKAPKRKESQRDLLYDLIIFISYSRYYLSWG